MSMMRTTSIRSLWLASAFSVLFAVPYAVHAATIDGPLAAATGIDDLELSDGNFYDVTFQNVSFVAFTTPAGVERDPASLSAINAALTDGGVTGLDTGAGVSGTFLVPGLESLSGNMFTITTNSDSFNGSAWTLSGTAVQTTVSGNSQTLFVATVQPVPLPGSVVLLVSGLGVFLFMRKRRGSGADSQNRTVDPIITNDVLYQLS